MKSRSTREKIGRVGSGQTHKGMIDNVLCSIDLRVRIDVTRRHERRLRHDVEQRAVRGGRAPEQPDDDELIESDAQMERQRERFGMQMGEPQVESGRKHVHQQTCTQK